ASVTPTPAPSGSAEPVDVEFDLSATDNVFSQTEFTLNAGQKFRFKIKNDGPTFVHNLRIAGPDGQFDTEDDLVSDPQTIKAGDDGTLVGKIDTPGTYDFRDDFHQTEMKGTIVVK
ncbi:MAG TPA: cupredoxin domain-containing protein, partial [Dehalococcoidia bacterium]|nr:cupredoxin domain-containing protein [Dehalococcoidia bacterium]